MWQGAGAQQLCALSDCLHKQLCKSYGHANACYRVLRTDPACTTQMHLSTCAASSQRVSNDGCGAVIAERCLKGEVVDAPDIEHVALDRADMAAPTGLPEMLVLPRAANRALRGMRALGAAHPSLHVLRFYAAGAVQLHHQVRKAPAGKHCQSLKLLCARAVLRGILQQGEPCQALSPIGLLLPAVAAGNPACCVRAPHVSRQAGSIHAQMYFVYVGMYIPPRAQDRCRCGRTSSLPWTMAATARTRPARSTSAACSCASGSPCRRARTTFCHLQLLLRGQFKGLLRRCGCGAAAALPHWLAPTAFATWVHEWNLVLHRTKWARGALVPVVHQRSPGRRRATRFCMLQTA